VFTQTYWKFEAPDNELLRNWQRIRELRDAVNREIEALRSTGRLGSSLQANVHIASPPADHALLAALGDDLRFVLITSAAEASVGEELAVKVMASQATKCERCWHWRQDVGLDPAQPAICSRCVGSLSGGKEQRRAA
jgi:isoleucyl-tRNA synthetase